MSGMIEKLKELRRKVEEGTADSRDLELLDILIEEAELEDKSGCHIVFILDETGSMLRIWQDTIGGFNTFLKEQKEQGEALFTFRLFSCLHDEKNIRTVCSEKPLSEVKELTTDTYRPRGSTPLWDAVGTTIQKVKGNDVIFAVMTDGRENSSKEFTASDVRALVKEKKSRGWKFIFLGANIDSWSIGYQTLGMQARGIEDWEPTAAGTKSAYRDLSTMATSLRADGDYD